MQIYYVGEQACLFDPDCCVGKTSWESCQAEPTKARTSAWSWKKSLELKYQPYMSLDLTPGRGNLWGESYWEIISPWHGGAWMPNTGVSPREEKGSSLSQILQDSPPKKYFLSKGACKGILRRAFQRSKELPKKLKRALEIQAGLRRPDGRSTSLDAFHINQRDEGIDLKGISGALMATNNMQMQTFVTQPDMPIAFAANQRDEVRDLHDVAGALGAQPKGGPGRTQRSGSSGERNNNRMDELSALDGSEGYEVCCDAKQQTFVVDGVVTKGNGDCFLTPDKHTSLSAGGGQAGQGYPCILAAFSAGAGAKAGGIGYSEKVSPTLKAGNNSTSVLCLNDQGGQMMNVSENITGTLRAQMQGHPPLVYENHGIDSRYTGPHDISPTISARAGTGGNNLPLVEHEPVMCIMGNAIDRQPQNGGNGLGVQEDIAYTITATDRHAIYNQLRQGDIKGSEIASTQCARQYKDATDLICEPYQKVVGALCKGDEKGTGSQYVSQDKLIVENTLLIRRLTPLECERLQGFPDGWTDIPGASDAARYKALGNSVAIPCVEYIMENIASVLCA